MAKFDSRRETSVVGELVYLDRSRLEEALAACSRYEGDGFRLVTIDVRVGDELVGAYAFEWAADLDDVADYVWAIENKVEIARYHLFELVALNDRHGHARIPFQAHAEGILYAGTAAADQLAEALNLVLGLGIRNVSPKTLLEEIDRRGLSGSYEAVEKLRDWWKEPLVRDARELRRRATHHHYEKAEVGPVWVFEEVEARSSEEPYLGPRDVITYCTTYIETLTALEEVATGLTRLVAPQR